jgi:hypothetical protein
VEGYGANLYIGGSDGVVEWWVCDGAGLPQVSRRGRRWVWFGELTVLRDKDGRCAISTRSSRDDRSAR